MPELALTRRDVELIVDAAVSQAVEEMAEIIGVVMEVTNEQLAKHKE